MKRFLDYYRFREDENQDHEPEKGLGDINAMPNDDEILIKLAKMAVSRHQERMIEFFSALSRHDDDIKRLLDKYKDNRRGYPINDTRPKGSDDKDVIAPNQADMSDPI